MIRARESHDPWALKAGAILDRVAKLGNGLPEHIDWALSYLGDIEREIKIPADLMGNANRKETIQCAQKR